MVVRSIKIMFFILLSFTLIACSTAKGEKDDNSEVAVGTDKNSNEIGKALNVAVPASPPGLDTHVSTAQNIADAARLIFENLVTVDSNFNVQPMLAESWEQSEDRKTITFSLRKGVYFHNGKEMIAEDVVASLERWFRISSLGSDEFAGSTLRAEDDYTVVLEMPKVMSAALSTLAYGGGNFASIMPKEMIDIAPDSGAVEYIGTGPFKFDEWVQDQYIYLSRNEEYQPIDAPYDGLYGKKEALVEGIKFIFVPDASTRIAGIQTGEYDIITDAHFDMVPQLRANSEIEVSISPYAELNIFYNKTRSPFMDVRVREAVAAAIDKTDILQAAFSNPDYYIMDHSLMMNYQAALWSSDAGKAEYDLPSDVEKAKKLLKEAGYNGEEITMITSKEQDHYYNASIVLQQQLEKIGMKVNLEVYDWPTYLDKRSEKDAFDLLVGATTGKLNPTSMGFLRKNFVGWTNDEQLDQIVNDFNSALSMDEAKAVYNELQQWFYDYKPITKVGDFTKVNATRTNVEGYGFFDGHIFWNVTNSK